MEPDRLYISDDIGIQFDTSQRVARICFLERSSDHSTYFLAIIISRVVLVTVFWQGYHFWETKNTTEEIAFIAGRTLRIPYSVLSILLV